MVDRTRTPTTIAIALAVGLFGATRVYGQAAADPETAPHGGEIVEIAEHHVEFKADSSGTLQVWLLDAQHKPLAPPSGATVTLMPAAGDQITVPLRVDTKTQRLVGQFDPKKFHSFRAVVSIPIGGKRQNVRFQYSSHL